MNINNVFILIIEHIKLYLRFLCDGKAEERKRIEKVTGYFGL